MRLIIHKLLFFTEAFECTIVFTDKELWEISEAGQLVAARRFDGFTERRED